MIKSGNLAGRMKFCIVLISILFLYVIVMFHHVQITRHDELLAKAQKKYQTSKKTPGMRGEIFDKNGYLLVGNRPTFNVCADPSVAGDEARCREIAEFLAPYLQEDAETLLKKLMMKTMTVRDKDGQTRTIPRKYVVLKNNIDYDNGRRLQELLKDKGFKSVFFRESVIRYYPKNQLLANILGFTTKDRDQFIATVGVEKFFNQQMQAEGGEVSYERTRKGAPIAYGEVVTEQEVKDGLNIYLTVEEPIQAILEEELDRLYHSKFRPKACFAVMADPWTGNILAIAQRPTFDPNDRSSVKPENWRNRIAEDVFEPGSTMKPISISGAIDRGIVTPGTRIDCEKGRWLYAGKILHDSHDCGIATVADIIKESSNIGTAKIAIMMGEQGLDETMRAYGIGQRTGIPLRPESRGIYPARKRWSKLSVSRIPMGQGVAVTTLQMVRAYCILANGGYPVTLNLVDRIEDPATGKVERFTPQRGPCIFRNPNTYAQMVDMMVRVAEKGGTGAKAAIPGYHIAVKTGTAEKPVNGRYTKEFYVSNFAGFIPAHNPRFVLMVVADSPDKKVGYYGATVAAPTFKAIAERTLKYMGVPRDFEPEAAASKKTPARSARR